MELSKPGLNILQPDWKGIAPDGVDALFTLRSGGVSSGPWGGADGVMGLNVAPHTGDFPACVRMNRSIAAQLVPADPVWLRQVHGTEVVEADAVKGEPEADASYTLKPGVVCTVMVGDCLPVLIAERRSRAVAAVHASWRSLAAGIVQKTVRILREKVGPDADFAAWLGPRIGPEAFEVGPEVLEAMKAHLPQAGQGFRREGGKLFCDLGALAAQALLSEGLAQKNIVDCRLSTYADPKRFYSYRRDGEKSGRHAAMIWIKPAA
jgi:polyphenol oxidase